MKKMRNRPFRTRRTIMKTRKGSHCGNAPGNPAATANPTCRTGPRTAALSPSCRASLPRRGPQTAADPGAGGCTTRGNSPADGAKCAGTLRKSYGRSPAIHALSFRCGTGGSATFAKREMKEHLPDLLPSSAAVESPSLKNSLHHPKSLKAAVLYQEILGKPRALRSASFSGE